MDWHDLNRGKVRGSGRVFFSDDASQGTLFSGRPILLRNRTCGKCKQPSRFSNLSNRRHECTLCDCCARVINSIPRLSSGHFLNSASYFRPKVLDYFGALQDGGITDNNPTEKALWELGCIWPDHIWPHFVLSVGTGHQRASSHDSSRYRGILLDGFLPRILRAFLSSPSLDAENSWTALSNRLPHLVKDRFTRLTVEFTDELPQLDNASQIPRLMQIASESPLDLDRQKRKLWASRFFFELQSRPEKVRDYYVCRGTVLCRFSDSRSLLAAIRRYCARPLIVLENKALIRLTDENCLCQRCGNFRREVIFEVPQLGHQVAMSLEFGGTKRNYLASFPKSIEWFVARQYKNNRWFQWSDTSSCCEERSKRKRLDTLPTGPKRSKND
jgi:hypothetical protein